MSDRGPVTGAATAASTAPAAGPPPHFDREKLAETHAETLATARRHYSLSARLLFLGLDLFYGQARTLEKFRVLELIARVPTKRGSRPRTSPSRTSTNEQVWPAASTTGSWRRAHSRTTSSGTCLF